MAVDRKIQHGKDIIHVRFCRMPQREDEALNDEQFSNVVTGFFAFYNQFPWHERGVSVHLGAPKPAQTSKALPHSMRMRSRCVIEDPLESRRNLASVLSQGNWDLTQEKLERAWTLGKRQITASTSEANESLEVPPELKLAAEKVEWEEEQLRRKMEEEERQREAEQLQKEEQERIQRSTTPCIHFRKGHCHSGAYCEYLYEEQQICRFYNSRYGCRDGEHCRFQHGTCCDRRWRGWYKDHWLV